MKVVLHEKGIETEMSNDKKPNKNYLKSGKVEVPLKDIYEWEGNLSAIVDDLESNFKWTRKYMVRMIKGMVLNDLRAIIEKNEKEKKEMLYE